MKCYNCKIAFTKKHDSLKMDSKEVGSFEVPDVEFFQCPNCSELLYPKETLLKIEHAEKAEIQRMIAEFPVSAFISSTEACKILDVTKQAFHKNRRIRNGFIFSIDWCGKKLYLKKSVLLFKENGDGRFKLTFESSNLKKQYGKKQTARLGTRYISNFYDDYLASNWMPTMGSYDPPSNLYEMNEVN
ncbi:MAG: hypothetical protein PHD82_01975 [Candidatus Riflebacteria bacterium]|nr:hypothetical protein [Candidatus Riflebacteria bacterium]